MTSRCPCCKLDANKPAAFKLTITSPLVFNNLLEDSRICSLGCERIWAMIPNVRNSVEAKWEFSQRLPPSTFILKFALWQRSTNTSHSRLPCHHLIYRTLHGAPVCPKLFLDNVDSRSREERLCLLEKLSHTNYWMPNYLAYRREISAREETRWQILVNNVPINKRHSSQIMSSFLHQG